MKTRGLAWAALGAIVLGVTACDDNPLAQDRDVATRLQLSATTAAVVSGDTVGIKVSARLINEYGAPTGGTVSAEACHQRLEVVKDTSRLAFEPPERFLVKATGNLGLSCIVIQGAGLVDTVEIRILPAQIEFVPITSNITSGSNIQPALRFLDARGNVVSGFDYRDVVITGFSGPQGLVALTNPAGGAIAASPGTANIKATLKYDYPITATTPITVVPALYTGAANKTTGAAGDLVTLTDPPVPFDADVRVFFNGVESMIESWTPTQAVIAVGAPGTGTSFTVTNVGPNQQAISVPFTVTGTTDKWGIFTTRTTADPDVQFATPMYLLGNGVSAQKRWTYFEMTVTQATTVHMRLDWVDDSDWDIWTYHPTGYIGTPECEAVGGQFEDCTWTVQPGTYYLRVIDIGPSANYAWGVARLYVTKQ